MSRFRSHMMIRSACLAVGLSLAALVIATMHFHPHFAAFFGGFAGGLSQIAAIPLLARMAGPASPE